MNLAFLRQIVQRIDAAKRRQFSRRSAPSTKTEQAQAFAVHIDTRATGSKMQFVPRGARERAEIPQSLMASKPDGAAVTL